MTGFAFGIIGGLVVSLLFFSATLRLPVYVAFRTTSYLLILFAGGLLARGIGEFLEVYPLVLPTFTFTLLPAPSTVIGGMIQTILGLSRTMNALQLICYTLYVYLIHRKVFVRSH